VELLSLSETAELTGLSLSTLAKRRCAGLPPAYFKLGRSVRYARSDIEEWVRAQRRTCTWDRCTANDNQPAAGRLKTA